MAEMEVNEKHCVEKIKNWVENGAEFYGRTDEAFLIMFARGCNFDFENAKKRITRYYENRRDIPEWWGSNRNAMDQKTHSTLLKKSITALIETGKVNRPTIIFSILGRVGGSDGWDEFLLASSICADVFVRRQNCQLNGGIWLVDCKDYKWWMPFRCVVPSAIKNFVNSFFLSVPFKYQLIALLNTPPIAVTIFKVFKYFMPPAFQDLIRFYGSDWSGLSAHMNIEWLPDEYGGKAGPIQIHDDAFLQEVIEFNDYLLDDSKYGYKS